MPARLFLVFVAMTVAATAQDAILVKAGDRAPDIDWTGVKNPTLSPADTPSLTGQYTILRFLPNITANTQAIDQWNDLIATFKDRPGKDRPGKDRPGKDRPVQFVWIASEKGPAVERFLSDHPIKSWLLIDERGDAARAYGCQRVVKRSWTLPAQ